MSVWTVCSTPTCVLLFLHACYHSSAPVIQCSSPSDQSCVTPTSLDDIELECRSQGSVAAVTVSSSIDGLEPMVLPYIFARVPHDLDMMSARARAGESARLKTFRFLLSVVTVISTSPTFCLSCTSTCASVRATCGVLSILGSRFGNPLPGVWDDFRHWPRMLVQVSRQCHDLLVV